MPRDTPVTPESNVEGTAMSEYDLRPVGTNPEELQQIAELFAVVWPEAEHLSTEYLNWQYADNPSGTVIGFNAWLGDELGGHYVVIPIRAEVRGEVVQAALSLNTAVHPKHQGRGLFTKLARLTYDLAQERGCHHVIGVANANSTPGFLRKLDFELLRPLHATLLWRSPTLTSRPFPNPPSWKRQWDEADLAWRSSNPSRSYAQRSRRGHRQLLAPTGQHGIQAILRLDRASQATALPPAVDKVKGFHPMLWMGLDRRFQPPLLGAKRLPERWRASPLNLIVRYLTPDAEPITEQDVEFEALDFDAY